MPNGFVVRRSSILSTTITVLEDGSIDGYLTVEEFAKKHGTTAFAIRQEIHRGYLSPLTIGNGQDRKHYFLSSFDYVKPKRGRPSRKEDD